jgi:ATP-dependent Clp protease protease subunit
MPWKIPNTSRWQWLSVKELLLRERILMVDQYIDDNYANAILAMLLYLQSEDASKPIQIYFNVPGAALQPSLAIYDTMNQLKAKGCKITTVSYSLCSGMGAFLFAAGTKGRRFATPNSLFRMSKTGLASQIQGQASEIELEAVQMLKEAAVVQKELVAMTGRTAEQIQADLGRDFYLDADKAVEYGLADRVMKAPDKRDLNIGTRDPWSGQVTSEKVGFGVFADPNQPRTATDNKTPGDAGDQR